MTPYKPTFPPDVWLFPGEAGAIATACALGEQYGYGNLIFHLRNAWSETLQREYPLDADASDRGAGHICPWCEVDSRTGKKAKKTRSPKKS